jgi:hypothetical protein
VVLSRSTWNLRDKGRSKSTILNTALCLQSSRRLTRQHVLTCSFYPRQRLKGTHPSTKTHDLNLNSSIDLENGDLDVNSSLDTSTAASNTSTAASTPRQQPRHLDGGFDTSTAASNTSTAAWTPPQRPRHLDRRSTWRSKVKERSRWKDSSNYEHSGASSEAYTALRTKLTTLNTADTTSSSFTGKSLMDIKGS